MFSLTTQLFYLPFQVLVRSGKSYVLFPFLKARSPPCSCFSFVAGFAGKAGDDRNSISERAPRTARRDGLGGPQRRQLSRASPASFCFRRARPGVCRCFSFIGHLSVNRGRVCGHIVLTSEWPFPVSNPSSTPLCSSKSSGSCSTSRCSGRCIWCSYRKTPGLNEKRGRRNRRLPGPITFRGRLRPFPRPSLSFGLS